MEKEAFSEVRWSKRFIIRKIWLKVVLMIYTDKPGAYTWHGCWRTKLRFRPWHYFLCKPQVRNTARVFFTQFIKSNDTCASNLRSTIVQHELNRSGYFSKTPIKSLPSKSQSLFLTPTFPTTLGCSPCDANRPGPASRRRSLAAVPEVKRRAFRRWSGRRRRPRCTPLAGTCAQASGPRVTRPRPRLCARYLSAPPPNAWQPCWPGRSSAWREEALCVVVLTRNVVCLTS